MNQLIDRRSAVQTGAVLEHHSVTHLERPLRLLCATDLSRRADRAMLRALLLSRRLGADLLLLHSIEAAGTVRTTRRKQVRAQIIMQARARKLAPSGRIPEFVVRVGQYQDTIVEVAGEWDDDLIILGSYRMSLGDSVIGTTAERVIRKASRPILVVNREPRGPYEHVLLTSDLSEVSVGAARLARSLGLLEDCLTSVVHALAPAARSLLRSFGVGEPVIEKYVRQVGHWTSDKILQQLEQAGLHTTRVSVLAKQGPPLRAIEHAAQLTSADMVVVGASHFPALKRIVIGSISNEVLRRLTCDVLLVSPGAIKQVQAGAM